MTEMMNTKHNVVDKVPEREIDLPKPKILMATTIKELVDALGEEMVFNDIMSSTEVKYRAKIRMLLAAKNDNGEYTNSDEAIKAMDFTDWQPETRQRQTVEDKILKLAQGLSPDQLKAILAANSN